MSFAEAKRALLRDLVFCVERGDVPPLADYLPDYVRSGCEATVDDYRLIPITAVSLRYMSTTSVCVTDCLVELQCKYEQFVADSFGGRKERGHREVATIGFNLLDGILLDVREIDRAGVFTDWVEEKLSCLDWQRLLLHTVVDMARFCQAKRVALQPAHCHPVERDVASDPKRLAEFQAALKQTHDDPARQFGFELDAEAERFVYAVNS